YWSSNGGVNFTKANGLPQNIMAPGVFYSNYGLAKDPFASSKRYGYFEGDGGGFFESNDEGKNWSLKNNIITGYKPSATLCVHPTTQNLFYLAVSYTGLLKTTNGGTTWANMSDWLSAWQVDARGNTIVAFGQRTGDTYDKIYKSTNSGSTWELISTGIYKLPNTTSLVINPHNTNQLWIGTTGNGTFIYDGLTIGITNISTEVPADYKLEQNYPNPFNPSTKINFSIPRAGNVKMILYDIAGREVRGLFDGELKPGTYSYELDAGELASGVYFYKLIAGSNIITKKMVLVK
ncbi:MAG TPA: T9SS type A sorting domain-containing protein, partial [Ignavibacteria bacterium]|nr:T9SS type A sorting domain-containing protein [Ignavibacteria bacterium]